MFNPQPKIITPKVKKRYVYRKKATGEANLFKEIWNERPHACEMCGVMIREANVINFHHVRTKAAYPELRLDKTNILILCKDCHNLQHS